MLKPLVFSLFGLAFLWLALWLFAQRAERSAEAAAPARGQIITINGSPMHVVVTGPKARLTLY